MYAYNDSQIYRLGVSRSGSCCPLDGRHH
jgi:hypothetical protein